MRILTTVLANATSAATSFNTPGISLEQQFGYSLQYIITGTPVGTLTIQGSNDTGFNAPAGGPVSAQNVVNWSTVTAGQAITTTGTFLINMPDVMYKWVRVAYTSTSGSGNITVEITTKGF